MLNFEAELRRIVAREKVQMLMEAGDEDRATVWMSQPVEPFAGFIVRPERRHGQFGFRVARYVRSQDQPARSVCNGKAVAENHYDWDERYQFYTSIDDFVAAIKAGDYSGGRAAF
jgi:hypothetical protein